MRPGIHGTSNGGSRLETWFDMKMYVPAGSILSNPTAFAFAPVSRAPRYASPMPIQYRKSTLPVMKVQGKAMSAAGGTSTIQNKSIRSVRKEPMVLAIMSAG